MAGMSVNKGVVAEGRNRARVAARLIVVAGAGEEGSIHTKQKNVVWVGGSALHLVEHDAVVCEGVVVGHLEMPTLLLKDAWPLVDGRMQDGVQVHVHEVLEVGRVGRGDRVHGLVRKGHGVEERLHGRLEQVDKGFLYREAIGTA